MREDTDEPCSTSGEKAGYLYFNQRLGQLRSSLAPRPEGRSPRGHYNRPVFTLIAHPMPFPFSGDSKSTVAQLLSTLPQVGRLEWIGQRPARRTPLVAVPEAELLTDSHLLGDHARPRKGGKRQVTLIQHEHLAAVAGFLGLDAPLDPARLRRNLVVSGLNLLALKNQQLLIGEEVVLDITGECHPCSRMEEELGAGGYNAMRGHGGLTAHIARGGRIRVGDAVRMA